MYDRILAFLTFVEEFVINGQKLRMFSYILLLLIPVDFRFRHFAFLEIANAIPRAMRIQWSKIKVLRAWSLLPRDKECYGSDTSQKICACIFSSLRAFHSNQLVFILLKSNNLLEKSQC